jgi:hypothetical protein
MRLARLALALGFLACGASPPPSGSTRTVDTVPDRRVARIDAAWARSIEWLLPRQDLDGAWRSAHYGAFKDGYALTPLVLSVLFFTPDDPRVAPAYDRGVDFLAGAVLPDGRVAAPPDGYSYPTESLALTIAVLSVPRNVRHRPARDALVAALRTRQLDALAGFEPTDPDYGGWGYGVARTRKPVGGLPPDDTRAANVSATLFAVGALRLAGTPPSDPVFANSLDFLRRCRADDGGYFFAPRGVAVNKAGALPDGRPRPYGSMTADALRAMLAAGAAFDDPDLVGARRWLHRNFSVTHAAGDYPPDRVAQRDAVYFYAAWSLAHALVRTGGPDLETDRGPVHWPSALADALLDRQRPDGRFENPATDLREDDPLLATPMALAALGLTRLALSGEWRAALP